MGCFGSGPISLYRKDQDEVSIMHKGRRRARCKSVQVLVGLPIWIIPVEDVEEGVR